jgi:leader peptidase (prepilin peptidase)/N-methyltransferase
MCKITDWALAFFLLLGAYKDWKKREVPIAILLGMGVVAVGSWIFCDSVGVWQRLIGVLIGGLFLIISKLTREAIGYGDSLVILILGLHMGVFQMLQTLCLASILAGGLSLFLLWKRKWSRSMTLPFLPFVTATYLGVMIWGK